MKHLILREQKGAPLSADDMDNNFLYLYDEFKHINGESHNLVLRKDLNRPLTHDELDNNFLLFKNKVWDNINLKIRKNEGLNFKDIDYNFKNIMNTSRNYFGNGRDGDLFTTGNVSFPSTLDGDTVYKYFNNMTINEDHIVTTENRCKGLVIYCRGDCTINGTLSMTARGCRGVGEHFKPNNLDKLKTRDGIIDMSIGAVGGAGGDRSECYAGGRATCTSDGIDGFSGINGACGGGGSGRSHCHDRCLASGGSGSTGTTWSGGSGGGGSSGNNSVSAQNGFVDGGNGGNAHARSGSGTCYSAGGGAGNPGGNGQRSHTSCSMSDGQSGTGGLLILIISGNLIINGIINSNGMNGGNGRAGGGSSGGGSITILHKNNIINNGTVQVNGGASISRGGAGGAGSIRIQKIL